MFPRYLINFDTRRLPVEETDYLVIGSGIAGLYTALKAASFAKVAVLTKRKMADCNTEYAQGGIAAAIHDTDSPALHRVDTLEAGAGLCDEEAVEVMVHEGPDRVRELMDLGAQFDRQGNELAFTREAAHSRRRILHAGDSTGLEIQSTLTRQVIESANINIHENHLVIDLLVDKDTCCGALVWNNCSGGPRVFRSKAVVLASGGAGQVYKYTTNPDVATGDGVAIAYRAGAELMDLEFFQFHPTALYLPGAPRFLISEAVRGEGAILKNTRGERFMPRYHPKAELASRDIVARSIINEMNQTGSTHVYLDLSPLDTEKIKKRFPTIAKTCAQYGIDIARQMIPVAPAAHYMMGGVKTNLDGETTIRGLYACGEVACQGVHGANRLASNSLLDGLVFGDRIVRKSREYISANTLRKDFHVSCDDFLEPLTGDIEDIKNQIREIMWEKVGLIRIESELVHAIEWFDNFAYILKHRAGDPSATEMMNLYILGKIIARAAFLRRESRGGHYRQDYPERDDGHWQRHIVLQNA
jgi:L-aspartate oxidase